MDLRGLCSFEAVYLEALLLLVAKEKNEFTSTQNESRAKKYRRLKRYRNYGGKIILKYHLDKLLQFQEKSYILENGCGDKQFH